MDVRSSEVKLATGEVFEVEYDFTTGTWFEKKRGMAFVRALTEGLGPETITWLLLAGVRKSRSKMNVEQMEEHLNKHLRAGGTLPEIMKQLQKALRKSGLLRMEDEGEGEPDDVALLTGSTGEQKVVS